MKWLWLVLVVAMCINLTVTDEQWRKHWEKRASDQNPTRDRICCLLMLALAVWQSIVLWSAR